MIGTQRHDAAVHEVRIDRTERRNALDTAHCRDLHAAVDAASADGARALVLTGEGTAFCSGADLDTVGDPDFLAALYGMLHRLTEIPVPVVAAVHGPAIGAGTQLALAADLRVVDTPGVFGLPTAALGLAVDPWTVRRLALVAGGGAARRILLACERLDHDAARAAGLVDRVGDRDTALAWATEIAALAPLTLAYNKLAVARLLEDAPVPDEVAAAFDACWASEDLQEGRKAREEKRAPTFRGR
ncbi:enoyl-CoA hydratase [Actinomycetospora flava]|uniref:Enoyl-CoA hydratase n=1 Tax=Actinomycetospora flava TaxID=3129232 RepID=A0ABU8MA09_9PSEU